MALQGRVSKWYSVTAFRVAVILATFCFILPVLRGQDVTGKVAGIVTDPSGAAVPGAKITVTNQGTQIGKETQTDSKGYYEVARLPVGNYEVSAAASGFSTTVSNGKNALDINQTLRIDLKLTVGVISNTVDVTAQGSTVETQNSTVGGTVTGSAIFELPLNGRNAFALLATQPGVTPTNPDNSGPGAGFSIGGGRSDSVTFLLDGGNNNNLLDNSPVMNPNPDAIAEFRVLESNYSAEYGRNAGGVVTEVTKSGTNSLHGTAYDYLRNTALNANDFFDNQQGNPRNDLKRNQFGGTIGGPIYIPKVIDGRNKLFFFFAYQGQRQSSVYQYGNITAYTPLEAQGNFSQSPANDQALVSAFLQSHPYYQQNPDLAAQGVIAPNRIDPVAANYFKNNLLPVSSTGSVLSQGSATYNIDEYLGRFDYNIGTRDTLNGTFSTRSSTNLEPFDGAHLVNVLGYPDTTDRTNYFGSVTYTHTFTPGLLNELRVTAQRAHNIQYQPAVTLPTPAQLGIGITPDQVTGPTMIFLQGSGTTAGFSYDGPTSFANNTYALYDNLSWIKGSHDLKFGFYFSPYQTNMRFDFFGNGAFYFYGPNTSVGSGYDLADLLLGLPDEYLQYPSAPTNIRSHQYAGYAQDNWHVTKRFTLNLGLRYEYAEPKYDTQGRSFSFIPGLQSTRFPGAPTGEVFPGDAGAPRGANFPDKNDFAPRFGFAWDVTGDGKTSVRGGFGVFYDILKAEDNLQFNGQAPFFGFSDLFYQKPATDAISSPGYLEQPFSSIGAVNPFPSKPPNSNINFADSGFLPVGGSGVFFVDPHLRTPYVYQYNFSVQRELATGLVFDVSYVGQDAHKLTGLVDVNPFIPGTSNRIYNPGDPSNSTFSYLEQFQNVGKMNYNSLQTSLTKRATNNRWLGNSFFTLSYTWSHQIDNVSGFTNSTSEAPYFEHNYFRSSGDYDVRNTLAFSGGWDLPFDQVWQHGPKLLTKGWSLYPIVSWHTGFPLSVSAQLSQSNNDPGPAGDGSPQLVQADLVGNGVTILNPKTNTAGSGQGNYYFNPGNFSNSRALALDALSQVNPAALIGQFTEGSFPRNGLRGPSFVNVDMSLAKHLFFFGEKLDAELRGDAFNLLNHTNFANPNTNISSSQFGIISSVVGANSTTNPTGPRIIQVALHLRF